MPGAAEKAREKRKDRERVERDKNTIIDKDNTENIKKGLTRKAAKTFIRCGAFGSMVEDSDGTFQVF